MSVVPTTCINHLLQRVRFALRDRTNPPDQGTIAFGLESNHTEDYTTQMKRSLRPDWKVTCLVFLGVFVSFVFRQIKTESFVRSDSDGDGDADAHDNRGM